MSPRPSFDDLVIALSEGDVYPRPADSVSRIETHISTLFFVGDRVYKVKKPVDLGFLDFSTLALRRRFCEEEVRLNQDLAPGVYRRVVPVVSTPEGIRVDGPGEAVEWAVEMERLPADRMLDRLLDRGEVDNDLMSRLAEKLVRFHERAPSGAGIEEYGRPERIRENAIENFTQLAGFAAEPGEAAPAGPRTLSPRLLSFLEERGLGFLDENEELFLRRVADKRIREGHGDLHAGNICCPSEGRLVIYDRIEFSPRFRCADVASDLAFLAMDLDFQGYRGFRRFLVRRYVEAAGDPDLTRLLDYYRGYYAVVRGKVSSITAASLPAGGARLEATHRAMRYFHHAAAVALPPGLILTCGLPGSGKSWVARHLAAPFEARILRSDVLRKRLAGRAPTQRRGDDDELDAGIYRPEMTERTYDLLEAKSRSTLAKGRTVVVDAKFSRPEHRGRFVDLARELSAPLVLVSVQCADDVVRARLRARSQDPTEVSDAGIEVYERVRRSFVPPDELPGDRVVGTVSGEEPPEEVTGRVVDALIVQDPTRGPREE